MQQCQDHLEFQIETPSDQELARRFADRQRGVDELRDRLMDGPQQHQKPRAKFGHKPRNRKSKQQKRQERNDRPKPNYRTKLEPEAIELACEGFEISPDTGIMSGCDQSCGDCPTCGK